MTKKIKLEEIVEHQELLKELGNGFIGNPTHLAERKAYMFERLGLLKNVHKHRITDWLFAELTLKGKRALKSGRVRI
jgi:hypothetical protein